ncbi:hypothetical protein IF188_06135 [Microbacterium sp. NEAU-LLC]|uniref:ECF transporter S component n=1 Tax=Microbacterium helvum TaxID=2773713 RepID=A0ABR8NQG1_9MICO|nr:hypothetical protein [Microbacterium helvum]MBD3941276.1 hypothetical protein [Microbacterium helvum]
MPTKTPPALGRSDVATLVMLLVVAVLAGIWPLTGTLTTWVPYIAIPAAAGLPFLWPPLRLMPLGETTWAFWIADTVGVLVMLAVAWAMLRAASRKRLRPHAGRAFGRGMWVTIVAMIAGNLVRAVFMSFAVHADLGTYLATLAAGILISALTAIVPGLLVGAVAALVSATARSARVA